MEVRFSERAGLFQASAIRNKLFDNPDIITFAAGKPEASLFPLGGIDKALSEVVGSEGRSALQYGPSEGLAELRELIAKQRMSACGVETSADNIALTSGSQEAIELSGRIFVDEGSYIACENPSYTGAFGALAPYAPRYVPIPMDDDGMLMDELEKALASNPGIRMIYTIPDFQNPTGVSMSVERRRTLAELAAKYRVPVIEDCPYGDLIFEGERRPAVKSFDKDGWVVMLGSFSKTLCPGLRLGWICASDAILEKYVLAKQGMNLQCGTLDMCLAQKYLSMNSLEEHIEALRNMYRERRDLMLECVKKYFPASVRCTHPHGGFFVWMELDPALDTGALLLKAAAEYKVAYIPGRSFFPNEGSNSFIRLSYSCVDLAAIEEGMKRLGTFITEAYKKL